MHDLGTYLLIQSSQQRTPSFAAATFFRSDGSDVTAQSTNSRGGIRNPNSPIGC